ncbi:putative Ribosomal RNA small subunit methyltransferase A [Candidatus Zixiibacteriota bacterium]|nr:putative Ribosomal RNA small subunit methyltransferase A [candidate division Zixibacteria bacterium]
MPFQKPKKRFSQNFLTDKNIAGAIVDLLQVHPGETVFEIGTGRGILTRLLADTGTNIFSFELDRTLIDQLNRMFEGTPAVRIVNQDFLKVEPHDYHAGSFKLIGNIPYDITSPLLEWMIVHRSSVTRAVITAQEELADRISSKPGSKNWAPLSIFCQCHFGIKKAMKIGPKAFYPPPKVNSATLLFEPRELYRIDDWTAFEKIVRLSFAHRRKFLTNNLLESDKLTRSVLEKVLDRLRWPPQIRAEEIDIEGFIRLTGELKKIILS